MLLFFLHLASSLLHKLKHHGKTRRDSVCLLGRIDTPQHSVAAAKTERTRIPVLWQLSPTERNKKRQKSYQRQAKVGVNVCMQHFLNKGNMHNSHDIIAFFVYTKTTVLVKVIWLYRKRIAFLFFLIFLLDFLLQSVTECWG